MTGLLLIALLAAPADPTDPAMPPDPQMVAPEPAAPTDPAVEAAAHFDRGEYEAGITALERAYAATPDPAFIFAQAAGYQKLERFDQAIELYEKFLAVSPPREQAQKAYDRIRACRSELERRASAQPTPAGPAVEGRDAKATQPHSTGRDARTRRSEVWHRDLTGGVLLGAGVAVGVTSGVLLGLGANKRNVAGDAPSEDMFISEVRAGNTMQAIGVGIAVTGGALIVGAIVRYATVRRRQRPTASPLSLRF